MRFNWGFKELNVARFVYRIDASMFLSSKP